METPKIISRAAAKAAGYKRYFTGVPCLLGHSDDRLVSDGRCLACSMVRSAEYRGQNRDLVNARLREKYAANPEAGRARAKDWYRKNADAARSKAMLTHASDRDAACAKLRERYAQNPEKHRAYARSRYASNADEFRAAARARYAANPIPMKSAEKRRRAAARRAVPPWFGELDDLVWAEASSLVQLRRNATGFEWHADHMLPLRAKRVSGLHVASNCQVIPAKLNMFKKNKEIMTEPGEWILAS